MDEVAAASGRVAYNSEEMDHWNDKQSMMRNQELETKRKTQLLQKYRINVESQAESAKAQQESKKKTPSWILSN